MNQTDILNDMRESYRFQIRRDHRKRSINKHRHTRMWALTEADVWGLVQVLGKYSGSSDSYSETTRIGCNSLEIGEYLEQGHFGVKLFQMTVETATIVGKSKVIRALGNLIQRHPNNKQKLFNSDVLDFIWNTFKDIEYCQDTETYLDGVLKIVSHLSSSKHVNFNSHLDDIGFCEMVGQKIRRQLPGASPSRLQYKVGLLLRIMHDILGCQKPHQVSTFISKVVVQISQNSGFYRTAPTMFLSTFMEVFKHNKQHKEYIDTLITTHSLHCVTDLHQFITEGTQQPSQQQEITKVILRLIPQLLFVNSLNNQTVFVDDTSLVGFYLDNLQSESENVKKAAWDNLEIIIYHFRESTLIPDKDLLSRVCGVLLSHMGLHSNLENCLDSLNTLITPVNKQCCQKILSLGLIQGLYGLIVEINGTPENSETYLSILHVVKILVEFAQVFDIGVIDIMQEKGIFELIFDWHNDNDLSVGRLISAILAKASGSTSDL